MKIVRVCSLCKRPFSEKEIEEKYKKKVENLQRSLRKAKQNGKHIGRPRKMSYEKIREMRKEGKTFRQIALITGCSCQLAFRACKDLK